MQARVIHSYEPQHEGDMALVKGSTVEVCKFLLLSHGTAIHLRSAHITYVILGSPFHQVTQRHKSGWWYGSSAGQTGRFPSSYVEVVGDGPSSSSPAQPPVAQTSASSSSGGGGGGGDSGGGNDGEESIQPAAISDPRLVKYERMLRFINAHPLINYLLMDFIQITLFSNSTHPVPHVTPLCAAY